jgi:hypothetical protein
VSGRVLIYDNASGDNQFGDVKNYVNLNYTPANATPGVPDTVLYGAARYTIEGSLYNTGIGAAVLSPGANVTFNDDAPGAQFSFGNLLQPYGSNLTFISNLSAGNVLIGPGATLDLVGNKLVGDDAIHNLWNEGGTLELNGANLALGGPGFIQTSGITSHETEVNSGINQWIFLGNVKQGSALTLDFNLLNGADRIETGSILSVGDGGFAPHTVGSVTLNSANSRTGDQEHSAGSVSVNTSALGGHWEQLSYVGSNGVMATTGIWDNVVKA